MTIFTIDVTDKIQLAGISAARKDHNDRIPIEYEKNDRGTEKLIVKKLDGPHPDPILAKKGVPYTITERIEIPLEKRKGHIATDQDYVNWVLNMAADSYAQQFNVKA